MSAPRKCRKITTSSQTTLSEPVKAAFVAQSTIIQIQNPKASRPRITPRKPHPPNAIVIESPHLSGERPQAQKSDQYDSNILQQGLDGRQALHGRVADAALAEIE